MAETSIPNLDQVKIVYNPIYEGAEQEAEHCVDRLRGWLANTVSIDTLPSVAGGGPANAKMLETELDPDKHTALGIRAGDGTFNDFVSATQEESMAELLQRISLTSMNEGGTACDIGTSLHGFFTKDPRTIFSSKLRATTAYALQCTIETPDGGDATHYAASYIGMGKSAEATQKINSSRYRDAPLILRDADIVAGVVASGHKFRLLVGDRLRAFSDLTYWKSGHMAKLGRAMPGQANMRVWRKEFYVTPVAADRASALYAASVLPFGRAAGFNTDQPSGFTTDTEVLIHFDGDKPITIPLDSHVRIELAPTSYTVLTTKKSPSQT